MNGLTDMFESFALETMGESIDDMVCEAVDMRAARDLYLSAMESICEEEDLLGDIDDDTEDGLDIGLGTNLGFDALSCNNKSVESTPDVSDDDIDKISECDEAFVASVFDGTISSQDMRGLEMEMARVL